ncbi:MAG: formate dehydrogenase accessory sulfurtransferase FdhD [Gammaproteobacteria bacterium]|nr:formate dehydrogenase accessory sulfurtransferase FdhD [Gammaproteobacteria bacterium]MCP4089776.1 formate dehydrogenase accessory sulfurtransferase FdhD [Gammaproteobacteria bacterium]MCP4278207.1 formate dehydrogenase accessory sulfurtransferase FdhD [Gammaproteobacteria bacterium]MCP4831926.1 formate dehydrogenase accessory sulfurtransferase FdhD [Gammaproteobacteria bacterium]MCP4927602.1 formate dehydrogenase accessory sulfurtransferase FdhD [Gammaproteobacteria bacterium]
MNKPDPAAVATIPIKKIDRTGIKSADDIVAVEEPLAIRLTWPELDNAKYVIRDIAVTMRTPGLDEELALGFLFTEGIILSADQVVQVTRPVGDDANNIILIELNDVPALPAGRLERNFFITSSCGICGKASIDAVRTHAQFDVRGDEFMMPAEVLATLPKLLARGQDTFAGTGSVHAAALFSSVGLCSEVYEDVGRHNAVDKLMGANLCAGRLPLWNMGLFVSGRSSFELVQKARMAGCAMLAAVGAPSSLAVELAWESDMTLVGFVRDGRFNVYAGPARIA